MIAGGGVTGAGQTPIGVVLAAGRGRRFGGPKQVAMLAGRPLVGHVMKTLWLAGLPLTVVVGPPWGEVVADVAIGLARDAGQRAPLIVTNDRPDRGMGTSLACAAAAVGARPLVVALADQPGMRADDTAAVVAALTRRPPPDGAAVTAVRVRHPDAPGHPVGFAARLHGELVGLEAGETGQHLLGASAAVTTIDVDHPRPIDIDTVADLQAVIQARIDRAAVSGGGSP